LRTYVGTSGWLYDWNLGRNFDWFLEHSGLNAVELNASFYRFPFPNQVRGWARKSKGLRWSIKVNRLITHIRGYDERATSTWEKFKQLFAPMDQLIDFYPFQLPPKYTPEGAGKLERFIRATGLGKRFAPEVRNRAWFKPEWIEWTRKLGITWVSVDCPDFPRDVHETSGLVYERIHGRTSWYSHYYTDDELNEIVKKIREKRPSAAYVFFNNDHDMLENAQRMLKILK